MIFYLNNNNLPGGSIDPDKVFFLAHEHLSG